VPSDKLPAKARAFLSAYRETASVTEAVKAAKISRRLHYYWLDTSPAYLQAFQRARTETGDVFEDEATRRAVVGTLEPVFYQGRPCGAIRRYSDFLLALRLRALKPEYREKRPDDGNSTAPPLIINVISEPGELDAAAKPGLPVPEAPPGPGGGAPVREDLPGSG
jgi:hypothetical protein